MASSTLALFVLALLVGCARENAALPHVIRATPARPAGGVTVQPGDDLQARVNAAAAGDVLVLGAGRHRGPVTVGARVTLWGPPDAVIAAGSDGTTVRVQGAGVALLGFTIDGSGGRFDQLDAAVHIGADDVLVEGVGIRNALFGILVEKSARVVLRGNEVRGNGDAALGLRGDTIRLWEAHDCTVEGNLVHGGRDMVVWYSHGIRLLRNAVRGGRYGTHFMYARDCAVEDSTYVDNVVGTFVMYSHGLGVQRNVIAGCAGAAGIGIGLKESGDVVLRDNVLLANTVGVFVDSSPLDLAEHNRCERNAVRLSDTAVAFHGSPARNAFVANTFADNRTQVRVDGGNDANEAEWRNNYWDDYQGYDLDGDGIGDLRHEVRSLSTQLTGRYRDLALFHGTPALSLIELTGEVMPIFRPKTLLIDAQPRIAPAIAAKGG